MILFALGQGRTVLVLSLPPKSCIPFRENIFHINTLSFSHSGNVRCHNHPILGLSSVFVGDPYGWAMTLILYVTFRPK